MNATITTLKPLKPLKSRKPLKPLKPLKSASRRALSKQRLASGAVTAVAVTLTALSLSHLAHGIEIVTHAPTWEAWAMATGIDLGFLSCEMAHLTAISDEAKRTVSRFARPTVIATLIASAIMNAFAFSSALEGVSVVPAVLLGAAIPALIYSLTRIGVAMWR